MVTTVVSSVTLLPGTEEEGVALIRKIWDDMQGFEGYVGHEVLVNQEDPCHIIQLGRWESCSHVEQVREAYKNSPVIAKFAPLLKEPRQFWVMGTILQSVS